MSVPKARELAKTLGFIALPGTGQFFQELTSLHDQISVACLMALVPARTGTRFHWTLNLNNKTVTVTGAGHAGDLERDIITALILLEAEILRSTPRA